MGVRSRSPSISDATEKRRADYVSATDLAAQEACLAIIRDRHPEDATMAEEDPGAGTEVAPHVGEVWIVDPLDGTANFLHNHPMHAASVALAIDGVPVLSGQCPAPLLTSVGGQPVGTAPGETGRPSPSRRIPIVATPSWEPASPSRANRSWRSTLANWYVSWRPRAAGWGGRLGPLLPGRRTLRRLLGTHPQPLGLRGRLDQLRCQ
jgi:hypothetical protein